MHNNKDITLEKNSTHWLTFYGPNNINIRIRVYVSDKGDHIVVDTDVHNAGNATLSTKHGSTEHNDFRTVSNEDWVRWGSNNGLTVAATTTLYKNN